MKTKFKKVFTTLLVAVLTVFGLGTSLFSASNVKAAEATTGSIVINSANDVDMSGNVFNAYQMFKAEKVGESGVNYTINPEWQGFFDEKVGHKATSVEARNYVDGRKDDMGAFAKEAMKYAESNHIDPTGSATASKDKATIDNLENGYYLVVDDNNDAVANSANIMVTVLGSATEVNLKADAPEIDKKIEQDKVVGDYNIGDKVPFTLHSKVPVMDGYDQYTFTVHDTMSAGLTFNNDVKVTIGGQTYEHFHVEDKGNGSFDIVFDDFLNNAKALQGQDIEITYTGTLNENAVIGNPGNPNEVTLEYSNNPNDTTSTHTTPKDEVKVYTFELDVTKTNDDQKVLPGAEFQLKDAEGNVIKFTEKDGAYVVDPEGSVSTIVSNEEGKIVVKGLDAGKYSLEETKAPDGYNKLENPIEFTISAEYDGTTLTGLTTDNEAVKGAVSTGTVSTTVVNKTGNKLPETGGRGIVGLVLAGIIMIAGASFILYRNKKQHAA